jgi:ABC-2 type transport system ATP-binding protein
MAQRVAILDHGELLVVDTPEALKRRIGEEDVLEIDLSGEGNSPQGSGADLSAIAALSNIVPHVELVGSALIVRARGVVDLLPAISAALRQAGYKMGEARLRANTLEDVFISLTGRRLRE